MMALMGALNSWRTCAQESRARALCVERGGAVVAAVVRVGGHEAASRLSMTRFFRAAREFNRLGVVVVATGFERALAVADMACAVRAMTGMWRVASDF
jgi:hypothetical protein